MRYVLYIKKNIYLISILVIFGILFSLISLVNHYNFRTFCFDFGLFNNAIYDYAHFKWNDGSLTLPHYNLPNTLADHFSLFNFLISPLYWIFGSYTLLIVQMLGILWGGIGIYVFIKKLTQNKTIALCAIVHFFLLWGIYSALAFGYHDNVMAAMFVPWFIYYVHSEKWKNASIYFLLILITKENMALWSSFITLGLIAVYYKEKAKIKPLVIFTIFSFSYFIAVVKIFIPLIADNGSGYIHFSYSALGENMSEAIKTIIKHPQYVFTLLFENHLNDIRANGIKSELHFVVLLSGGLILLYRPQFLIMLLPIFAQKLFNDNFTKWGLNYHYSIEFAPILTIALFHFIHTVTNRKKQLIFIFIFIFLTGTTTLIKLERRVSQYQRPLNRQFYKKEHYTRTFDTQKIYDALKLIPPDVSVSAQNTLVPHLCFRDKIYLFPYVGDAEYIVLIPVDVTHPLSKEEYKIKIAEFKTSAQWEVFYETDSIIIFKKKPVP